jgi:hypoxanthine phosphoribosyltransferase
LAQGKEKAYYKAVRRAAVAAASPTNLKDKLTVIVRGIARAMNSGASIVLLDSERKRLIHSASWGLPQYYLRKGVLDARRSLSEVATGQPVVITDIAHDDRVQYRDMAVRAGITSILGVPVLVTDSVAGSLRVYARELDSFTNQDITFTTTMASLAALALASCPVPEGREEVSPLQQARSVTFVHPSEEEFTRILDFYNLEWVYEPRSFPLRWDGDRVTEMFTPDFYLPALDLYVELTTLRQSLVTEKNRKLRHLREIYPNVKITLLYKNDYDRLLAKYGIGPLAQTRAHGINRVLFSATEIGGRVRALAEQISGDYIGRRPIMVGLQRGFLCFMADLIRQITIPLDLDFMATSYYTGGDNAVVKITKDMDINIAGRHVIVVEDIVDTGITLNYILNHLKARRPTSLAVCTLLDRRIRRIADISLNYIGFEVPDEFVVGYGLDYHEEYRNLPFIGIPEIEGLEVKRSGLRRGRKPNK